MAVRRRSPIGARLASVASALVCGGACGGGAEFPRRLERVQVVACRPALPTPSLAAVATTGRGRIQLVGNGWDSAAGVSHAAMMIGRITSDNPIDTDGAERAVKRALPALEMCFRSRQQAAVWKFAAGWVVQVGRSGQVTRVVGVENVLDAATNVCASGVLKEIEFPIPTAGRASLRIPLVFDSSGVSTRASVVDFDGEQRDLPGNGVAAEPWTPFANQYGDVPGAEGIAQATATAVADRIPALEGCFAATQAMGSLRAVIQVDGSVGVTAISAGGLGDGAVETCVERALVTLHVAAPAATATEIACDLARGDAKPWHVSLDDGYELVTASRTELHHGDVRLANEGSEPEPIETERTALIVLDADTPGSLISLALSWVNRASTAVIAVRTEEPTPRYLAMGRTALTESSVLGDPDAVFPTLRVGAKTVTACLGRAAQAAPLTDLAAVSGFATKLAEKCKTVHCAGTLLLSVDADAVAATLLDVAASARRAGFQRVLLGTDAACRTGQ